MLCNPYLIDFYSLARGYGMATAFMACSTGCMFSFSVSTANKWYYASLVFAMLAAYANFAFLLFWFSIHFLLIGILLYNNTLSRSTIRTLAITVCLSLGFVLLCAAPLIHARQSILHDFYLRDGFYRNTVLTITNRFIYGSPIPFLSSNMLSRLACGTIIISTIYFLLKIKRNISLVFTNPFCLSFILLILVWATNIVQVHLTQSAYITDRTALIYYVLFIFVLLFLLREWIQNKIFGSGFVTVGIAIFFVLHFINAVNFTSVYEWSFDAYTYDVLDYIESYRNEHKGLDTVELNLTNYFRNSFYFATAGNTRPWLKIKDDTSKVNTLSQTLFYYATAADAAQLKNYIPVKRFVPTGGMPGSSGADKSQLLLLYAGNKSLN